MSVVTQGLKKRENQIEKRTTLQVCQPCNGSGTEFKGKIDISKVGLFDVYDDCSYCSGMGNVEINFKKIKKNSSKGVVCF